MRARPNAQRVRTDSEAPQAHWGHAQHLSAIRSIRFLLARMVLTPAPCEPRGVTVPVKDCRPQINADRVKFMECLLCTLLYPSGWLGEGGEPFHCDCSPAVYARLSKMCIPSSSLKRTVKKLSQNVNASRTPRRWPRKQGSSTGFAIPLRNSLPEIVNRLSNLCDGLDTIPALMKVGSAEAPSCRTGVSNTVQASATFLGRQS